MDCNGHTIETGDTIRIPDWTFPVEWNGEAYVYMTPCRYATVTQVWASGEIRAMSPNVYDMTAPRDTTTNPFPYEQYFNGPDVQWMESSADRLERIRVSEGGEPSTLGVREYTRDARGRFAAA